MKAGFDTTVMDHTLWCDMLGFYNFDPFPKLTDSGWVWKAKQGFVVTSHDPVTGYHFNKMIVNPSEVGMLGYIGIEGDVNFVREIISYVKENAEFIKDECINARNYI